jgi:hypothetical protein
MATRIDLAQPECDMFERNLAHLASRGREVLVRVGRAASQGNEAADGPGADSSRVYQGFLAGLDEGYVQLCRTDDQAYVLISRDAVTEIEATGRSIWTYEKEGLAPNSIKRIKDGCGHFIQVAKAVASRGMGLRDEH